MTDLIRLARTATLIIGLYSVPADAAGGGDLAIIGLKLGITIDQAKEKLQEYNKDIKIVTLYATDNRQMLSSWNCNGNDPTVPSQANLINSSKVNAPIAVVASLLTHAYDVNGQEVTGQSNQTFRTFKGEGFRLCFTPTDDGGHLYAISRTVTYPEPGIPLASLQNQFLETFGQPSQSNSNGVINFWMYDVRGRQLPENSRDFGRCVVQLKFDWTRKWGEFNSSIKLSDYTNSLGMVGTIVGMLTPQFYSDNRPEFKAQYRQCGVQLETFIDAHDRQNANGFTIRLSDQNATYFNNGVENYLKVKLSGSGGTTAPPEAPRL